MAIFGRGKTEIEQVTLDAEMSAIEVAASQAAEFAVEMRDRPFLSSGFEDMADSLFELRDETLAFWRKAPKVMVDPVFASGGFYALADLPEKASSRQKIARFIEWGAAFRAQAEKLTEHDETGIANALEGVADAYVKIGAALATREQIAPRFPLLDFVRSAWNEKVWTDRDQMNYLAKQNRALVAHT